MIDKNVVAMMKRLLWRTKTITILIILFSLQCCLRDQENENGYKLSFKVTPENAGVVMGSGEGYYFHNGCPLIVAVANKDYRFVNWTDTQGDVYTEAYLYYTMPAQNVLLTVNFQEWPWPDDGSAGEGVTDVEGNHYETVWIGGKEWMAQNLRTSKYSNGDNIPSNWGEWDAGAYAVYPHVQIDGLISTEEVLNTYGALYNWFAVMDNRGLCPTGWHVPSNIEWSLLALYVDHNARPLLTDLEPFVVQSQVAGGRLKSTNTEPDVHPRWDSPNTGATNLYGFSALPGGLRFSYDSTFVQVGYYGIWWSTSRDILWPITRVITAYDGSYSKNSENQQSGLSVRCLKD